MFAEFLESVLGWQVGTVTLFFGMTVAALSLLNKDRKEEIALWLMGAMPEATWHKTFLSVFDALFYGSSRSAVRFFIMSALISTIAVSMVWYFMHRAGNLRIEMGDLELWEAVLIGVAINCIADYISLLETRFLLSRMPKNALLQVLVLVLDAILTGLVILFTIWLATQTTLVPKDRSDPLTVMLAFSIYSAPFYSTFLTSIWSWLYIATTWILRLFTRLRLSEWMDVENRPIIFLSFVMSMFIWLGAFGFSQVLKKDPETQISALDGIVCETFKGDICLALLAVTEIERTQLLLQLNACDGDLLEACQTGGIDVVPPSTAVSLLNEACLAKNSESCLHLGILYQLGLGVDRSSNSALSYIMRYCSLEKETACGFGNKAVTIVLMDDFFNSLAGDAFCLENANGCSVDLLSGILFRALSVATASLNFDELKTSCGDGDAVPCLYLVKLFASEI